jgi:dTDP-glucose 4,6-dehydratase
MLSGDPRAVIDADASNIAAANLPWEQLAGARVAVTGASGFLGGYLVRTLLALNRSGQISAPVTVFGMVRDLDAARATFSDIAPEAGLSLVQWDFSTPGVPDIDPPEYVIHAASQASPRFYAADPVGTLLPNIVGTLSLLRWLQRAPSPRGLLFVSSSEVYGVTPTQGTLSEHDYGTLNPAELRACYAEGKRAGETLCIAWQAQFGLPTFIVRPFHTYGPGLKPEDGRVFADFAFNVLRGENIVMSSDGTARRAFCYGADAVEAFFTVLLKGEPAVPYNVGNPDAELSVLELAELLVALYPERGLVVERHGHAPAAGYMPSSFPRLVPNIHALRALGWEPRVAPEVGFRRMIGAYE